MSYVFLSIAILAEVIATSTLKFTEQFTRLGPSVIVVIGYVASFYFLALTLKEMNLGIAYAIWCSVGIVGIALVQHFLFKNALDLPAIIGMALIVAGVVVMNLFSESVKH